MKKILVVFIAVVALLFGVTFTIRNPQVVELSYYFGIQWQGPLSWLVIMVFALGVLIGIVISYLLFLKRKFLSNPKRSKPSEV
ncbi:MAG: LapA family protein [Acidiferrobacterales bacterium]|nr:LapA family protein [Acidiferrobacterales bacterium]